jgi:hypothetical protein
MSSDETKTPRQAQNIFGYTPQNLIPEPSLANLSAFIINITVL